MREGAASPRLNAPFIHFVHSLRIKLRGRKVERIRPGAWRKEMEAQTTDKILCLEVLYIQFQAKGMLKKVSGGAHSFIRFLTLKLSFDFVFFACGIE